MILLGQWITISNAPHRPNAHGFILPFEQLSSSATLEKPAPKPHFSKRSISIAHDSTQATNEVHSGSLALLGDNRLFAVWYGGTREGARDVKLYKSTFSQGEWSAPAPFMTVEQLAHHTDRYIKKLGNPVTIKHTNGTLFVFFNSVTLGGWAGSAINMIQSQDNGQTFSAPIRLVTSPFHNISTLVRTAPFLYANGDIGLPIYHEFIGKYSELLRISPAGAPLYKQRISHGDGALQPSVALHSHSHATKWQRNANKAQGRVLLSTTKNGGQSWTKNNLTAVPNPDAALTSIGLSHGALLVYNHSEHGRYRLSLGYVDTTGQDFIRLADIEYSKDKTSRFSYPQIRANYASDFYELVYTANRKTIEHVRFNQAWLNQQLLDHGLQPLAMIPELLPLQSVTPPRPDPLWLSELSIPNASAVMDYGFMQDLRQSKGLNSLKTWLYTIPLMMLIFSVLSLIIQRSSLAINKLGLLTISVGAALIPLGDHTLLNWGRGLFGGLSSASWCVLGAYVYHILWSKAGKSKYLHQLTIGLWRNIAVVGVLFYPLALGWGMFDPYQLGYTLSPYFNAPLIGVMMLAIIMRQNILIVAWLALGLLLFAVLPFESVNLWDYLLDPLAVIISLFAVMKRNFQGIKP